MQAPTLFVKKLKEIHSEALARTNPATAEAARQSESSRKFRDEYSALASRLNREIVMPTLIRLAGAIPNVSGPHEANEKVDDDFEAYDAICEIAPITAPEERVRLRVRLRPDTVLAGITIECEISSREAELFHDATDFAVAGLNDQELRTWVENAVAAAYRRFCELHYPPAIQAARP